MKPQVSIVIPLYNKEKYLEECLNAILQQTYSNWECVICDNCSTDNSYTIAASYAEKDSRFRLFKNENFLLAVENWNNTYSKIDPSSKYVKLEPADDWMFPEYLEKMVTKLEEYPSAGICLSYRLNDKFVDCDGLEYRKDGFFKGVDILLKEIAGEISVTGSLGTPLYRVEAIKKVSPELRPYNKKNIHADTELAQDVLAHSDACFIYEVLSFIRRDVSTITSKIEHRESYFFAKELYLFKRLQQFPSLKKEYIEHRYRYAYFLLLMFLKAKNSVLNWHLSKLERKITTKEYVIGLLKYNFLTRLLTRP